MHRNFVANENQCFHVTNLRLGQLLLRAEPRVVAETQAYKRIVVVVRPYRKSVYPFRGSRLLFEICAICWLSGIAVAWPSLLASGFAPRIPTSLLLATPQTKLPLHFPLPFPLRRRTHHRRLLNEFFTKHYCLCF